MTLHPFIFFDEVQNIEGWDKFVRRLNDQGFDIFITGSNSRMLGREIGTALRGRTLTYEIFPFSFLEYLDARNIQFDERVIYGKKRHQIRQQFDKFIYCAISIYLLIGIMWAGIYTVLEGISPGSFSGTSETTDLLYFGGHSNKESSCISNCGRTEQ